MRRLSAAIDRPVTFALLQVDAAPDLWRELMDESLGRGRRGRRPLAPGRRAGPPACSSGHSHDLLAVRRHPRLPGAQGRATCPPRSWSPPCATPRCAAPSSAGSPTGHGRASAWRRRLRPHLRARRPARLRARPRARRWPAIGRRHRAHRRSRWPTTPCSTTTARACSTCRSSTTPTATSSRSREMLLHPRAARGLADGGAHCGVICDAVACRRSCSPTGPATARGARRSRSSGSCKKQTHDTARLYGLGDRGTHRARHARRPQRHRLRPPRSSAAPYVVDDLPAGGKRLLQGATGYVATIKSGVDHLRRRRGHRRAARPPPPRRPLIQLP